MSGMTESPKIIEERVLVCFDRIVMSLYRDRPDMYHVLEDDMGGELEYRPPSPHEAGFIVRFGFRKLVDGQVCVAAFGPDLMNMPDAEKNVWRPFLIASPIFAESDPQFHRWSQRSLHGSWISEDGPLRNLERELELISAMTRFGLGEPLFRKTHNPALRYPAAENSVAFTNATLELYRLVVDGLSIRALEALVRKLTVTLPRLKKGEKRGTMNTLKAILPRELHSTVHAPLKAIYDERSKIHGVPSQPAYQFPAISTFHRHAAAIQGGTRKLRLWLEDVLQLSAEICLSREEAMQYFPKFSGPLRPEFKDRDLQQAVGKTIERIETGEVIPAVNCHRREALILHFTDGTSLGIDVGSNALNLSLMCEDIRASDFEVDLIPSWAPDPRNDTPDRSRED